MGLTDNSSTAIPRIMVFRPTLEEMKDFSKYLEYMESQGANKAGLAKIIPPPEWVPRKRGYDDVDITIKAPIQQVVTGGQGLYQQYNIQKRSMSIKDFKKLAESAKYKTPTYFDYEDLERKYWKNVTFNPAIYGADVPGSLTDEDCKEFNINNLNTILDMINESYGIKIMGVNTAYLYFGMWKTTFAWHTEDMDLYSINYLHFGSPKSWYCIPPEHGKRLERLANGFFPNSYKTCPAFLRHKMTLISPQVLKKYSIPFNKITQESGEFMITFPYAYHAGYNHGYNCAESTNFALSRWVEFGKRALRCMCRADAVKISMEAFVKRFQPDRYELWLEGKDIGPDPKDPCHICAAPAPSSYELNVMSKFNKHKRHPPHKKDYSSDTEEYVSDEDCPELEKMFSPPTKAARKMFETNNETDLLKVTAMAPSIAAISADAISSMPKPPSISDTILRLHKNLNSSSDKTKEKKRKKRSNATELPPHMLNHSYAKPNQDSYVSSCTQPNSNNTNYDYFAHISNLLLNDSSVLNPNPLQSKFKLDGVCNALHSESTSTTTQSSDLMSRKESSIPSQSFSNFNNLNESPFDAKNFQMQAFTNFASEYAVKSEVNPTDSVKSAHIPPPIIPYYEYSPLDNLSPPANPPLLNPHEFSNANNFFNDKFLPINGSDQVMNGSKISDQKMVEASTSTEDLVGVNHVKHSFNTCNHSNHANNSSLILEQLSQKTLQYTPPTFGPSPEGFADEIKFNLYMSTIEPHCAVCNLLRPFELNEVMELSKLDAWTPPKFSPILIPSIAFTSKVKDESTLLDSRETSPLIVCMDCRICVHSVCYGASDLLFDGSERNWRCDRCEKKDYFAFCCLCPLRGGPLKETTNKKWVHLSCALLVPDVLFVNGISKRPIELNELKSFRKSERMGCVYCRKIHPENKMVEYLTGYCIQCTTGSNCYTSFHVTCGHRQGVLYQAGDWPDPIVVTCKKCTQNSQSKKKQFSSRNLREVELGEKVIAKHKNKRYYNAKVVEKIEQVFHHVHFVDNSFTKNLKSCDILNRDCEKDPPEIGDPVEVIWNKEQLHGKYTGNHSCKMYSIMFDDGSQTKIKREDFYLLTDELPKRVQLRLSTATERLYKHSDESNSE